MSVARDSRGPMPPPLKSEGSSASLRSSSTAAAMEVRSKRVLKILRKKSEVRRRMLVKEVIESS